MNARGRVACLLTAAVVGAAGGNLLSAGPAAAGPARHDVGITTIDGLVGVEAVDNRGEVLGAVPAEEPGPGFQRPVIYSRGRVTPLLPHDVTDDRFVAGGDLNDHGQVVVTLMAFNTFTQAYFVDRGDVTPITAIPGAFITQANAINHRGRAAVTSGSTRFGTQPNPGDPTRVFPIRPFLWDHGQATDLGTLSGDPKDNGYALDINDRGQVVGSSDLSSSHVFHATLWDHGRIIDLGTLGGTYSEATAINNRGQVVGWSDTRSGERHGFLWQDGQLTDLGNGVGPVAVNERGQVVGSLYHPDVFTTTPFVWQRGQLRDLGDLVGSGPGAADINERGDVVGVGTNAFVLSIHNHLR